MGREWKSGWKYICKCFVYYRWKGLTGRYGYDIIEMMEEGCKNRFYFPYRNNKYILYYITGLFNLFLHRRGK